MSEEFWKKGYKRAKEHIAQLGERIGELNKRIAYLEAHPICPVCQQELEITDSGWYCASDDCDYGDPLCEKVHP